MQREVNHPGNQVHGEFDSNHWVDRLPLNLTKLGCFILMAFTGYLCAVSESLEDRLLHLCFTYTLAGIYANLAYLKNRLKELIEPPLFYYGYPIFFCATIATVWYEYLRW